MSEGVDVISYYYDDYENVLYDDYGEVFCDVFRIIPPWRFNMYKKKRGTFYVKDKTRDEVMYEFVFPLYGDEEDEDGIHYY